MEIPDWLKVAAVVLLLVIVLGVMLFDSARNENDKYPLSQPTYQEPWSMHDEVVLSLEDENSFMVLFKNTYFKSYSGTPSLECAIGNDYVKIPSSSDVVVVEPDGVGEYNMIVNGTALMVLGFVPGEAYPCKIFASKEGIYKVGTLFVDIVE